MLIAPKYVGASRIPSTYSLPIHVDRPFDGALEHDRDGVVKLARPHERFPGAYSRLLATDSDRVELLIGKLVEELDLAEPLLDHSAPRY